MYPSNPPAYVASRLKPVVSSTSELGSHLPIIVKFINSGPSLLLHVNLVIFLPLRNSLDTGEYYYLYPLDVVVSLLHETLTRGRGIEKFGELLWKALAITLVVTFQAHLSSKWFESS